MISVTIRTDNDAFYDADGSPAHSPELARILRELANSVAPVNNLESYSAALKDANGNTAGRIEAD